MFIPGFSVQTALMTNLLCMVIQFVWTSEAHRAIKQLKAAFPTAPVLAHLNPAQAFVVEDNASSAATGGQTLFDARAHSKFCTAAHITPKGSVPQTAEQNYEILDKELLAIKSAIEEWSHHLKGAPHLVQVSSDHNNLKHLRKA